MNNKAKAKIWAKVAQAIEERGIDALERCGLCSMGTVYGLDSHDTYGEYDDLTDTPISGVCFLMGHEGDWSGYLWPKTEEGAEHRVIAAQLMACFLEDEADDE